MHDNEQPKRFASVAQTVEKAAKTVQTKLFYGIIALKINEELLKKARQNDLILCKGKR